MGPVCEALGQQGWGTAWNTRGGLAPRRLAYFREELRPGADLCPVRTDPPCPPCPR